MTKRRDFLKRGLLFTTGATYSPDFFLEEYREKKLVRNESVSLKRNIPLRYEADIIVVGGGIAGVSAAASAATSGAKVILLERLGALGGMLTTGGVSGFCDQLTTQGEVFDEILSDLKKFNSLGDGNRAAMFNYEILALVLQEILLNRNVKILLHTRLVDVLTKGRNITECIICGKSGMEAVRGKIFIDCSGDANLARYAGFSTMKGDEKTGYQLPMSKTFLSGK